MIDTILLLYAIVAITILVGGLFLMASSARTIPEDKHWHPMADGGPDSKEFQQYMRKVTKRVHPEMKDVEPGTELMGVNFGKTECDLEEYKDLQARIDALRIELEDQLDDGDDEGGLVVRK